MKEIERVKLVRARLKHAWGPFFTKFGRLTPIQIAAIPKILDGSNVIVASPTASGKTEAVVAPVTEKFLEEGWGGLAVLYIVPTRALANDTLARIEGPLQDMSIRANLKHGDRSYLASRNLPNFLITTPESLDSLICRRPHMFRTLRTVILDEIHLLDNTYRGDQLRILMRRLEQITSDGQLHVHLLSATLSSPYEIAQRYVSDFDIVQVPGQREVDYQFLNSHEEIYHLARKRGWRKLLYFCNLRESVETIAADISDVWHPYPVVTHHGSLGRRAREEAEAVMKESRVAVCVATSTLEIGIDIGDIDVIVLAEPPWSVSSLLQRIGRGNRRRETIHVIAITNTENERLLLDSMFKAAISGVLAEEPYTPDLSVAVQQTISYLYQNPGGVSDTTLIRLLSPLCSNEETMLILGHLRRKEWIEKRSGIWTASTRLMDAGEKGQIHSNIPDSQSYKVIDIASGKEVGTLVGVVDEVFVLAGRIWQIVSVKRGIIKARRFRGKASAPIFRKYRGVGSFYWLLPPQLKTRNRT